MKKVVAFNVPIKIFQPRSRRCTLNARAAAAWGSVPDDGRYANLKDIKLPVLIVNGRDDVMVPSINSFILQQHIPNATLIIYPDSGHGALFQFSDMFVEHVTMFLGDSNQRDRP